MIDPDKIRPSLVEAVQRASRREPPPAERVRKSVAAFLDALLADDEAMERASAYLLGRSVDPETVRDAIIAAVTEGGHAPC